MCSYIRTIILNMQEKFLKLQEAMSIAVKKHRGGQSISRLSNEIDLSKSIWSEMEKGRKDIQLSTFFRISEALAIKPSELLSEIEDILGKDFSFIED